MEKISHVVLATHWHGAVEPSCQMHGRFLTRCDAHAEELVDASQLCATARPVQSKVPLEAMSARRPGSGVEEDVVRVHATKPSSTAWERIARSRAGHLLCAVGVFSHDTAKARAVAYKKNENAEKVDGGPHFSRR